MVFVCTGGFSSLLVVLACCSPSLYFHPSLAPAGPADFQTQHQDKTAALQRLLYQLPQLGAVRFLQIPIFIYYTHVCACTHTYPSSGSFLWLNHDCTHTCVPHKPCFTHHYFLSGLGRLSGGQCNFGHPETYPLEFSSLQSHSTPQGTPSK